MPERDGFEAVRRKFGAEQGYRLAQKLRGRADWADFEADPAHAISTAAAILADERAEAAIMQRMNVRWERFHGFSRLACVCTYAERGSEGPAYVDPGCELHSSEYVRAWGRENGYRT